MSQELPIPVEEAWQIAGRAALAVFKRVKRYIELDDLKSEAMIGLLRSIKSWDPEKSTFDKYAFQKARWHLFDYLRATSWVPRKELQRIHQGEAAQVFINSMSHLSAEDSDYTFARCYRDINTLEQRDEAELILRRIGGGRAAMVLRLHYLEGLTYKQIGPILGLHETRICQLHNDTITRAREAMGVQVKKTKPPETEQPLSLRDQLAFRYMELLITRGGMAETTAITARDYANAICDALIHPYEPQPIPPPFARNQETIHDQT